MIAKYIFRDFHLVTAKRPLYQPNIPETFADRDFAEENVNGHYRNHLFDIPHVTHVTGNSGKIFLMVWHLSKELNLYEIKVDFELTRVVLCQICDHQFRSQR